MLGSEGSSKHEIADLQTPPLDVGGALIISGYGDVQELFGLDHFKTNDVGNQHRSVCEIVGVAFNSIRIANTRDR